MEMMEEYGYLGSAPHMAFTSILIGVVFWQQLVSSIQPDEITLGGIAAIAVARGMYNIDLCHVLRHNSVYTDSNQADPEKPPD